MSRTYHTAGVYNLRDGCERHAWPPKYHSMVVGKSFRGLHNKRNGLGRKGGIFGECIRESNAYMSRESTVQDSASEADTSAFDEIP